MDEGKYGIIKCLSFVNLNLREGTELSGWPDRVSRANGHHGPLLLGSLG